MRGNGKHSAMTVESRSASPFLVAVADRLPPGRALDVAMGEGRNAIFLARRNYQVVGIDRRAAAVVAAQRAARAAGVPLEMVCADLEHWRLPASRFDVAVNIRYLQRSLVPSLRAAVRPGGMIVFETFLIEQMRLGHPRNPAFFLAHGELRELFSGFDIVSDA